jgi:hypothetical protein
VASRQQRNKEESVLRLASAEGGERQSKDAQRWSWGRKGFLVPRPALLQQQQQFSLPAGIRVSSEQAVQ